MQDWSSYEVLHTALRDNNIMMKNVLVVFFFFIYNIYVNSATSESCLSWSTSSLSETLNSRKMDINVDIATN